MLPEPVAICRNFAALAHGYAERLAVHLYILKHIMDITTLDNDITAYCMKASSFPEGVRQAHESLHALIPFDKNRKYFGISYPLDGQINYWAAAAELNAGELSRHGLDTFV